MIDEKTLADFDRDEEVRSRGRSAVFRKLAAEYIRYKKQHEIDGLYKKAYGNQSQTGEWAGEFDGWEDEGVWPEP